MTMAGRPYRLLPVEDIGVVKLFLLQRDVDPSSQDKYGRTPLSYAIEKGARNVVKLLQEGEEISSDSCDGNGRKTLSCRHLLGTRRCCENTSGPQEC